MVTCCDVIFSTQQGERAPWFVYVTREYGGKETRARVLFHRIVNGVVADREHMRCYNKLALYFGATGIF